MEHLVIEAERRHFLGRLVREISRAEQVAIEHAAREARRLGEDTPPASALRALAAHAEAMQPRLAALAAGYGVPPTRGGLGTALAALRDLIVDRIVQGERAYRIALLDLRNGLDLVKLFRESTRGDQLLGLIRWCDDWLSARRPLLAHAERELTWFSAAAAPADAIPDAEPPPDVPGIPDDGPPSSGDRPSSHDRR